MTTTEALDWIKITKEHYELDDSCQSLAEALEIAIKALEHCEAVKQIIIQHDSDRLPEDYWYIDKIREVVQ